MKNCCVAGLLALGLLAVVPKALPAAHTITIDTSKRFSDVSHGPVGLCMNYILDRGNESFVDALKSMHMKTLRYPMGTYANVHMWNADNPARPKLMIRDRTLPTSGHGMWLQDDFTIKPGITFDEFVSLCRSAGCEPVVMVGMESLIYQGQEPAASKAELIDSIKAWVRYANVEKKYGIKYWELGNENDLDDPAKTIGRWPLDVYIESVKEISAAMKSVDPTVNIGANTMTKGEFRPLIRGCGDAVDFLVTHNYATWINNYDSYKSKPHDWTAVAGQAVAAIRDVRPGMELLVTEFSGHASGTWANGWMACKSFEMAANLLNYLEVKYIHFWETMFFSRAGMDDHAFSKGGKYNPTGMGLSLQILAEGLHDHMVSTSRSDPPIRSWASAAEDGKRHLNQIWEGMEVR